MTGDSGSGVGDYREKMREAVKTGDRELFREALDLWLSRMRQHHAERESRRRTWLPYKD